MIGHLRDYSTGLENIGNQPELSIILSELITSFSRSATKVVAASDSLESSKQAADYICDGLDDQVQIQAALDTLPTTGGEVLLLDGTHNTTAAITMDSYQTLRGCGRNTILTSDQWIDVISATGSSGTEKEGILIADLCINGQGGCIDNGINWTYVDKSKINNVWPIENYSSSIYLNNSDKNEIIGNWSINPDEQGIYLNLGSIRNIVVGNFVIGAGDANIFCNNNSNYNTITGNNVHTANRAIEIYGSEACTVSGNVCEGQNLTGIYLMEAYHNTITGNTIFGSGKVGIELGSASSNNISGNTCRENGRYGIEIYNSHNNAITGNNCQANSQTTDNTYDNIYLELSGYNLISNNICRQGAETNQPRYGINISTATCEYNSIIGNDLYNSGETGNLNDIGTLTIVRDDNKDIDPFQVKHMVYAQNTSGGNLTVGNVVSYEAAASAVGFHSPTAIGDPLTWGMLAQNINNNAFGYIQVLGGTALLDATNAGGGAIAIGDLLCTEVGSRARKVASGHMALAIAMEACDAANCVINALIITPRYVA